MNKKVLVILSTILLTICCMNLHIGYGIYQILRWLVTITGIVFAIDNYKKCQWKFVICCVIAVLFNPVAPIYLAKEIWMPIDICTAITFLCVAFLGVNEISRPAEQASPPVAKGGNDKN